MAFDFKKEYKEFYMPKMVYHSTILVSCVLISGVALTGVGHGKLSRYLFQGTFHCGLV